MPETGLQLRRRFSFDDGETVHNAFFDRGFQG